MFTGIITATARPITVVRKPQSIELTLPIPKNWQVRLGDSIAIDGICATVKNLSKTVFSVYFMAETIDKTSLKRLTDDHAYNLEQPITLQDVLGGHITSGHVDTTAVVSQTKDIEGSRNVTFSIDPSFTKYMIYKGSICINGASLTLTKVTADSFSVSLIPYTLEHTNLGTIGKGSIVNIEVDMFAKYLENFIKPYVNR